MKFKFDEEHSHEKRIELYNEHIKNNTNNIILVIEKSPTSRIVAKLPKNIFTFKKTHKMGIILYYIRKVLKINEEHGLFLYINGTTLISNSELLETIYDKYKCDDNLLKIMYCEEHVFG
jgi:hypothetical protein